MENERSIILLVDNTPDYFLKLHMAVKNAHIHQPIFYIDNGGKGLEAALSRLLQHKTHIARFLVLINRKTQVSSILKSLKALKRKPGLSSIPLIAFSVITSGNEKEFRYTNILPTCAVGTDEVQQFFTKLKILYRYWA